MTGKSILDQPSLLWKVASGERHTVKIIILI